MPLSNKISQDLLWKPSEDRAKIAVTAYGTKSSLLDLKRDQCRWPIGEPGKPDFGFCAGKAQGSAYCKHHKAISSAPPKHSVEQYENIS